MKELKNVAGAVAVGRARINSTFSIQNSKFYKLCALCGLKAKLK